MEQEEKPQRERLHPVAQAYKHWYIDVSHINICGTFYYLCSLLDGCSHFIIHWEVREQMTEMDEEIILQRVEKKYPDTRPATDYFR